MKLCIWFRNRWYAGLGTKFTLMMVAVLVATLSVTSIISYRSHKQLLDDHLRSKADALGKFIALISPEAIHNYDFVALDNYMREITRIDDVVYGVVIGANGKNMTSYIDRTDRHIAQAMHDVGSGEIRDIVRRVDQFEGILPMEFPIALGDRTFGTVRVGISTEKMALLARYEMFKVILGAVGAALFLAVCIYFVFRVHVLRPILALIDGSERVARGQLLHDVTAHTRDELGKLAASFNQMVHNLRTTIEEKDSAFEQLQELNRTLEQRVIVRTSELAAANKELQYLALHDPLTGLPNRALLADRLERGIIEASREHRPLSMIILDLDRFKEINDALGHNVGDVLLKKVSVRLALVLREVDTVARLGGDEFAIILPSAGMEEACGIATLLLGTLEPPFLIEDQRFSVGGSIGIAVYPEHGETSCALMQRADVAMYMAKRSNSGYSVYDPEEDQHSPSRLALMSELRGAINHGDLVLCYQPKIELRTRSITGVEALVRWPHAKYGIIEPDQFIPLAEQTGLIRPLTAWVLSEAVRQWRAWHWSGQSVTVSVNLSMRNLQDPELPAALATLLRDWGIEPKGIAVEITESALMADPGRTIKVLQQLHAMGLSIAIDDFGTGYSSLSHLKRMPVDELKIDKSFVMDMARDKDDAVIVRSTIDLAHNLGLKVTAEGVESDAVLCLLTELGCDYAQGNFVSKPLRVGEFQSSPSGSSRGPPGAQNGRSTH